MSLLTATSPSDRPVRAASATPAVSDRLALSRVVEQLGQATAAEPEIAGRLALADTAVELRSPAAPDASARLTLTAERVEFATGAPAEAEVTVVLGGEPLRRFAAGELSLPMAILSGEVAYRGPVRKFLRVTPILRHMLSGRPAAPPGHDRPGAPIHAAPSEDAGPVLEQAAAYAASVPAAGVVEEASGDFWSIECRGVHKSFDSRPVLAGVDLGIPEGAITVVLGPSGTGKSVLLKHIIGLLFPDAGDVVVHGRSLSGMRLSELLALRSRLGILFQDGALFSSMNLYDNVAFPLRQHTNLSDREIAAIVEWRLRDVGLADAGARLPSELSGGMRKRAGLARAIVFEPEVVLFDEPDSGLDPVRTALLCDLILALHARYGGTYVVITHDIATARRIGEYLAVLWQGQIVESGPAGAMFESANPFVRQFLAAAVEGPLGMD